jgi:hypothetical protein
MGRQRGMHEADHPPPSTAEVKVEWSYILYFSYTPLCLVQGRLDSLAFA